MFCSPSGQVFDTRDAALKSSQSRGKQCNDQFQPQEGGQVGQEEEVISLSDDDVEEPPKKKARRELEARPEEISPQQEAVLVSCYSEWPRPSAKVVSEIVKDTGLAAQVVKRWYWTRTRNIIQQLLSQDK